MMKALVNKKSSEQASETEISVNHQKLIDATIETIAKRGLADTTIAHVAKRAKVSQGYANFRFKSKDNLLISSLQYLSDEYKKSWQKIFEEKNIDPIDRIIRIIQNDFSSKIANRNKISVLLYPRASKISASRGIKVPSLIPIINAQRNRTIYVL